MDTAAPRPPRPQQNGRTAEVGNLPSCRPAVLPLLLLLPLLFLAAGCELTEKTVAPGESVIVAQSIISRTRPEQWVLLEYSLAGDVPRGPTGSFAPPQSPRLPISGAFVTVERHGFGPLDGAIDTAVEAPIVTPGAVASGVYTWQPAIPYQPGERLALRILTPGAKVVTGSTVVPGASAYHIRVGATEATQPFQELPLNRVDDTLHIGIDPAPGRAMQVEVRNADNQDDLTVFAFTDSLGIAFAGNLVNPFEGDSGETVFRAGRSYLLTVALTDTNYYDFIRSRSDPFTGRGYLNHLEGGLGVFGSVEAQTWVLRVTAPQSDPDEGTYHVSGALGGFSTDLDVEVFKDDLASVDGATVFSAFVDGRWPPGELHRSGDGLVCHAATASAYVGNLTFPIAATCPGPGYFALGFRVEAGSADSIPSATYTLIGTDPGDGGPFRVAVTRYAPDPQRLDSLTIEHVRRP